jgi:hypothetical protein
MEAAGVTTYRGDKNWLQGITVLRYNVDASTFTVVTSPRIILFSCGCAAAGAAFLCISYRGKLLQHTLIRVQCSKKSTRVYTGIPCTAVRVFGLKKFFWKVRSTTLRIVKKNIQPVHEDSKFRTVDLGRTKLGVLRTCARMPRARARAGLHSLPHYLLNILCMQPCRMCLASPPLWLQILHSRRPGPHEVPAVLVRRSAQQPRAGAWAGAVAARVRRVEIGRLYL